uniref:Uncharacterized protein n=1 Tax=Caenorhabditis japonica TaxID=281687 RepID=A0A8R1IVG5_CAEJA
MYFIIYLVNRTRFFSKQVVENEDVYDRPTARSVCMDYDAVITNVETQKELDDVNGTVCVYFVEVYSHEGDKI